MIYTSYNLLLAVSIWIYPKKSNKSTEFENPKNSPVIHEGSPIDLLILTLDSSDTS